MSKERVESNRKPMAWDRSAYEQFREKMRIAVRGFLAGQATEKASPNTEVVSLQGDAQKQTLESSPTPPTPPGEEAEKGGSSPLGPRSAFDFGPMYNGRRYQVLKW